MPKETTPPASKTPKEASTAEVKKVKDVSVDETKTPKEAPAAEPTTPKEKPASGPKKRILIVEDERPLAHALELKMAHEGYETKVASTGTEGLKEATDNDYDIILLDLILPEIDGFTILEGLKDKKKKPVIIVLSNLGQDEDRKKAAEYGAKEYLVKSNVPLADIVGVVKSAI
jgi:CheY-like chemotaxis protein